MHAGSTGVVVDGRRWILARGARIARRLLRRLINGRFMQRRWLQGGSRRLSDLRERGRHRLRSKRLWRTKLCRERQVARGFTVAGSGTARYEDENQSAKKHERQSDDRQRPDNALNP